MTSKRTRSSVEKWTPEEWYQEFFIECRLPTEDAENYSVIFAENDMHFDMLPMLNKDLLKEMSITKVGHIIEILRVAQSISPQEQRSLAQSLKLSTSPPLKRKVTTVKSVVSTPGEKQTKTGKNNDKKVWKLMKRTVPQEGRTLTVKMPQNHLRNTPPSEIDEEEAESGCSNAEESYDSSKQQRFTPKPSISENGSEKKKSVFERLGSTGSPEVETPVTLAKSRAFGGILKKSPPSQEANSSEYYGPHELPRVNLTPDDSRRVSTAQIVYGESHMTEAQTPPPRLSGRVNFQGPHVTPERRSVQDNQVYSIPGPSSSKESEPSFHVTMSMKLHNPLVTKVTNGTKKLEERRNLRLSGSAVRKNSTSSPHEKYYGSMAADQVEMSKEIGLERDMKQRLGSKAVEWNTMEGGLEKKRVSFGNVRTKEIPALPGTQPLNTISLNKKYTGSIALRTAKRVQL